MSVVAVTPVEDASAPAHPDHARWVKERTLAMEVAHAQLLGGSLRTAEDENNRLLEEMEARIREDKPAPLLVGPERRERRVAERGVTRRDPKPLVPAAKTSPCGRCGTCVACIREKRVFAVIQKANQGDLRCAEAVWRLSMRVQLIQREPIGRLDRARKTDAVIEAFCDDSVKSFGPWR